MRNLLPWLTLLLPGLLPLVSCSKRETASKETSERLFDTTATATKPKPKLQPDSLAKRAIVIYTKRDTSDNLIVYGLDWRANERVELGRIPPQFSRRFSRLQVSPTGRIAYIIRDSLKHEHLVMADGNLIVTVPASLQRNLQGYGSIEEKENFHFEERHRFPDYALSPNGETLAFCDALETATWDSSASFFVRESKIFTLSFGDTVYKNFRSDTLDTGTFFDDTYYARKILGWSRLNPNCIFLGSCTSGQLETIYSSLWHYDFTKQDYVRVDSLVARYLSMSHDENRILFTNNDGTCCGNINDENNLLLSYDRASGIVDTLFNEYQAFNNEKKAEEHKPDDAEFSPDQRFLAFNLYELFETKAVSTEPDSISEGDTHNSMAHYSVRILRLEDHSEIEPKVRKFLGWLDAESILAQTYKGQWLNNRWHETFGPVCTININTGEEKVLLDENEKLLKIAWF